MARLDRTVLGKYPSFSAEFADKAGTQLNLWSPTNPKGIWKSDYYFGNQRHLVDRPLTRLEQLTSRTLKGELQVYGDKDFTPNWNPFWIGNGGLNISALRLPAALVPTVGLGREYVSGLVSTQLSFSQVYGYFEFRVYQPLASGTWSAGWLLPVEKTAENLGRLPEIDIWEHYAGPHESIESFPGKPLDRTGIANVAVHEGVAGKESLWHPKVQPKFNTGQFNVYGLLWTPTELVFYLNGTETARKPFVYNKPMYLVMNVAVSRTTAGKPELSDYRSKNSMIVDYVRVYPLAG